MKMQRLLKILMVGILISGFFNVGTLFCAGEVKSKRAAQEAAEKAARKLVEEKVARDTAAKLKADKEAKEQVIAAKMAKEKAAKEAIEKAAKEAAEKVAAEKAAAEKAAKGKVVKEKKLTGKAAKEAADKAAKKVLEEKVARDKAAKAAADKAAREKAVTDRTAREQTAKEAVIKVVKDKKIGAESTGESKQVKSPLSDAKADSYWLTKDGKYLVISAGAVATTDATKDTLAPTFSGFKLIPVKESAERTGGITYTVVTINEAKKAFCLANENGKLTLHDYVEGSAVAAPEGWNQMTGLRFPDTALRNGGITLNSEVMRLTGAIPDVLPVPVSADLLFVSLLQKFAQNPSGIAEADMMRLGKAFAAAQQAGVKVDDETLEKIISALKVLVANKDKRFVIGVLHRVLNYGRGILTPEQFGMVEAIIPSVVPGPISGPTPLPTPGPVPEPGPVIYKKLALDYSNSLNKPTTCFLTQNEKYLKVDGNKLVASSSKNDAAVFTIVSLNDLSKEGSFSPACAIVYGTASTGLFNVQRTADNQLDLSTRYVVGEDAKDTEVWFGGSIRMISGSQLTSGAVTLACYAVYTKPEIPSYAYDEDRKIFLKLTGKYLKVDGSNVILVDPKSDATPFMQVGLHGSMVRMGASCSSLVYKDTTGGLFNLKKLAGDKVGLISYVVGALAPDDEQWWRGTYPGSKLQCEDMTLDDEDVVPRPVVISESRPTPIKVAKKPASALEPVKHKYLKLEGEEDKYIQMADRGMAMPVLLRIPDKTQATDFRVIPQPVAGVGAAKYMVEFDWKGKSWRVRGTAIASSAFDVVAKETPLDPAVDVWGHAIVPGEMNKLHNGDKTLIMEDAQGSVQPLAPMPASVVVPLTPELTLSAPGPVTYTKVPPAPYSKTCVLKKDGNYLKVDGSKLVAASGKDDASVVVLINLKPSSPVLGVNHYAIVYATGSIGAFNVQRTTDNQLDLSTRYIVEAQAKDAEIWSEGVYPGGFGKLENGGVTLEYEKVAGVVPTPMPASVAAPLTPEPTPPALFVISATFVRSLFDSSSMENTIKNLLAFGEKISKQPFTVVAGANASFIKSMEFFYQNRLSSLSPGQKRNFGLFVSMILAENVNFLLPNQKLMIREMFGRLLPAEMPQPTSGPEPTTVPEVGLEPISTPTLAGEDLSI